MFLEIFGHQLTHFLGRFAVLICFLVPIVTAIELDCTYSQAGSSDYVGSIYICLVTNLQVNISTEVIEDVTGTHETELSNDNVQGLYIYTSPKLMFLPKGIESFFTKLETIAIKDSGLSAIRQSDLEPFPNLLKLWIIRSKLTALDSGLFKYNPNLQAIYFNGNEISTISADLFDPIGDLEKAYFSSNVCINKDGKNREAVKEIKQEIIEKCQIPIVQSTTVSSD